MKFTKENMRKLVEVKPSRIDAEMARAIIKDVELNLEQVADGSNLREVVVDLSHGLNAGLELAKMEFAKKSDLDWNHVTDASGQTRIVLSWR